MESFLETLRGFPDFAGLPDEVAADLSEHSLVQAVPANKLLTVPGSHCEFFPVVLTGQARIYTMDEDGREVTLYRLGPGDGCVLSAACTVSDSPSPGFAVSESAGDGLFIPAALLRAWVDKRSFWRNYVFTLVARQIGKVVAVTNELAFRRLDSRIAGFLLHTLAGDGDAVRTTHQEVAMEVGTRREVASRILKDLEQDGILALGRGVIRVRDRQALSQRATPAGEAGLSLM